MGEEEEEEEEEEDRRKRRIGGRGGRDTSTFFVSELQRSTVQTSGGSKGRTDGQTEGTDEHKGPTDKQ